MNCKKIITSVNFSTDDLQKMANTYFNLGVDALLLWDDRMSCDKQEDELINAISSISSIHDAPIMVYQTYPRFEDIKKILYAGASAVVMNPFEGGGKETLKEGVARFGENNVIGTLVNVSAKNCILPDTLQDIVDTTRCTWWMLKQEQFNNLQPWIEANHIHAIVCDSYDNMDLIENILSNTNVSGICSVDFSTMASPQNDYYNIKESLKAKGIPVALLESAIAFEQFKCNDDGLIPVITQDYKTGKVLMLAYMNEESYNETIRSGRMTYYSRSRKCLWKKGDTSGHYQYVKSLDIDCDKDTILAKVHQIGAACHTGSESCFFTNIVNTEYDDTNPGTILDEIMTTVCDRKEHPKEGSYTNYLFDKGIDKILKKVGEEAAEIIIAAKNPDTSELKYEISDFLYHMIVLMVEKGVTWEDVSTELAKRH